MDNVSRESPAIEVDRSLTGERVVAVLERLALTHGRPKRLAVDNGPEFISKALDAWAHRYGVKLEYSRPGTPTDNAYIEAFNGRFREECLDQHWFVSVAEAREIIEAWRQDYTTNRPHGALNNLTPQAFLAEWDAKSGSAAVVVSPDQEGCANGQRSTHGLAG